MFEQNEKKIPLLLIVIFAVLGIVGYSLKSTGNPIRVLFKTKGGPVVFDHRTHDSEYDIKCDACHHEVDSEDSKYPACRECHRKGIEEYKDICEDRPIHKLCIGANCIDCHKKNDMDTGDCKSCHQ